MASRAGTGRQASVSSSVSANTNHSNASSSTVPINSHRFQPCALDDVLHQQGLTRYHLQPPTWRAPWLPLLQSDSALLANPTNTVGNSSSNSASSASASSTSTDLHVYPQFFPPCDGQDEDQLTDNAVKIGYGGKNAVQTETFSAHQLIYEKLKSEDILGNLSRLADAVNSKAQLNLPGIAPPSFKLPKRNIVTDTKREQWFTDLSNPSVPLSKLFSIVPHGYRGQQILEMFYAKKVPCARAIWFVRTFGALEIQNNIAKRSASATSAITSYTSDWTTIVQDYVRKQLAEISIDDIALPGASFTATPMRSSLSTKAKLKKAVLGDIELRSAWSTKFSYTLRLLEALYEEHLLDRDSFLRFIIQQVDASNIGQLPFTVFLAEEYLGEFLSAEPLAARLMAACFSRLESISKLLDPRPIETMTSSNLTSLIRSTFLALPDAFVAAPLWSRYSADLARIVDAVEDPSLVDTVRIDFMDLKLRAEAASKGTEDQDSSEPDDLETIDLLDSVTFPVSLATIHKSLFHKRRRRRGLEAELPLMFTWATCGDRTGSHRRYAVAALIAMEKADLSSSGHPRPDLERAFIDWIDDGAHSGGARKTPNFVRDVRLLLEELIRTNVIGYSLYLQRMIARGETEVRDDERERASLHLRLLRSVALHDKFGASVNKRRMALNAVSTSKVDTKSLMESVSEQLCLALPSLFDATSPFKSERCCTNMPRDAYSLISATLRLFEEGLHLVLTREFIPSIVEHAFSGDGPARLSPEEHSVLVHIYLVVEDIFGLSQYLVSVLSNAPSRELVSHVLDIVEGYLDCWASLNALPSIAEALLASYETLKAIGVNERRLIAVLRRFGSAKYLDADALVKLEQDYQELVLSLSTSRAQPQSMPTGIAELQGILLDSSPQAIAHLATTLWYRYHSFDNWAIIAFDSSIQLLAGVSAATIARFLKEINERIPTGLEIQIGKWVAQMQTYTMVATFGAHLGSGITSLFVELVTEGIVSASGLVSLVLVPVWRALLATATSQSELTRPEHSTSPDSALLQALDAIARVFGELIGKSDTVHGDPAANRRIGILELMQDQRLKARRATLYTQAFLSDLGRCIGLLAMQRDMYLTLGFPERAQSAGALLLHLNCTPMFQMVVVRDPQTLASAILDCAALTTTTSAQNAAKLRLLAAVLLTLKDGNTATPASLVSTEDWDLFLSGLTTWRLAISKVEVQACLERLDLDSAISDNDKVDALFTLSRHFLDRVCSGEGHTYLGEQVVKCYHGRASDELVSVAFARLAEAVDGLARTASKKRRSHSLTTLRCTGRVLNTLLQSSSATSHLAPLHQLLGAVRSCLDGLIEDGPILPRDAVLYSAHLLATSLRCLPAASSSMGETADLIKACLLSCARLALIHARTCSLDSEITTALLDTCSHLLFGLSTLLPNSRISWGNTFLTLHSDFDVLSDSTRSRFENLFGLVDLNVALANPWDLVDHADPSIAQSARHNNGPLDLGWFGAKIVCIIPPLTALDVQGVAPSTISMSAQVTTSTTPHSGAALYTHAASQISTIYAKGRQGNFDFETPCIGLSVAARDHRRTLMAAKAALCKYDPNTVNTANAHTSSAGAADTLLTSASSSRSAPQPLQQNTSSASTLPKTHHSTITKRKDPPEVVVIDSDDDDEDEGSAQQPTRASMPKRGRPATKSARGGATGRKRGKG